MSDLDVKYYSSPEMWCVEVRVEKGFMVSEYGNEGEAGAPLEDIDNGIF